MAGFPGGGSGPSGVPKFWAPAAGPVGDSTTYIARAPTFVPTWRNWVPPGGIYGFVDYSIGFSAVTVDTTHILRAPTFTPTWQPWRLENRGFVQSVPLTLQPGAVVVAPTLMSGVIVWSNPQTPQRSVDLLTWTQSLSAPDLLPPFAQDDWPNPVRPRPVIITDWIAETNVGLLRPDVNPFSQDDWPNPRAPLRGQDFGASTNLGLLRPDVAPFSQDDWPNPRGAQRGQDFVASTNLGLLRPDVNPFIPHDWANPRLALQPVSDWLQRGIQAAVVVQPPFAQYDWPNRLASRQPVADWMQQGIRAVVQVGTPFAQDDWPNPVRAVDRGQYQKWTDYYSIQILPPPPNYDWPNPRGAFDWRAYQGFIEYSMLPPAVVTPPDTTHILRAPVYTPRWEPRRSINLYSLVNGVVGTGGVVPPAAQPFLPLDWPNPIRLADRGQYQKWSDYYSIQIIPPQTNYDQPNPRLPQPNRADWIQGTTLTLRPIGVVQAPLRPIDWPIPRGWPAIHVGFASGINRGLLRPDVNPFGQDDWPNRSVEPRRSDWIQSAFLALTTVIVTPQPFAQDDWPNPRGLLPANAGFAAAINLGLLRPDVAPFAQRDWPNPRAALRGPADYVAGTNLGVLRPDVNPEINYDWPNPQAARRAVADWIQSAFIALATAPPPPAPFAQTDWPVPRGAIGVHVGSTSATQLGLLRPDINPFLPRDFANPRAPLRSIDLYGWVQALSALIIPPPPPPTFPPNGQYNWPNPAGPQRGIDLFGWSQSPTALTLPETIIPPPEVLQPGGRAVPHTFSRKKWRELQMLIAAEMAAVAKAEELTKRGKREALLQAARAAAAAVDAAEAEGENKRLDKLLVRNALTLRAAIRAASEVKLLRETASAIEQSRAIVQRQQDEEDEMINLLMLS